MNIEPDFGHLRSKVKAQLAGLDKDIHVGVDVDRAGLSRARSGLGNLDKAVTKTNRNFQFFRNTISLIKFPALIAGAGGAAQAVSALGAGAVGLTGALGPLSGALIALPAAFGAAAQGAGTALLAFSGLGDALGAMSDQQAKAGATAVDSASQQRSAAESIKSAEESLAQAQRTVKVAQEDLTQARVDASRQLHDMRLAAQGAALGEERALLSLQDARNQLRQVQSDPSHSFLEERDALLAVQEAQLGVKEARTENARSQKDLTKAEKDGVGGSKQVVDARRSLADAQRAAATSTRALTNAQLDAASAMKSGGAAADLVAQKMAKLPPAARQFAKFLFSLKPALDQLRQAAASNLFPGLQRGIEAAMKNLPVLQKVIADTAAVMGNLAERAGKLVGSKAFGRDLGKIGRINAGFMNSMGEAGISLANALRHIMVAAGPLIKWMGKLAEGWAANIEGAAKTGRETGSLAHFFRQTRKVMERVFSIAGHLAGAFYEIGKAAAPLGRSILAALDTAAGGLESWTKSVGGKNALEKYFHDARAPLFETGRLIGDVVKGFFKLGTQSGLTDLIHQVRVELLPVMQKLISTTTQSLGPALVDLGVAVGKMAANFSGSGGVLTGFVKTLTWLANAFNSLPGPVQSAITQFLVFTAVLKAFSFASALTGVTKLIGLIKWVNTASKAAAASTTLLRLQLVALAVQEKVVAAFAAMRAAMAAMIPTTIGLTFAIRALVAATVIGALITAAILIATHWKLTKEILANVWGWIKDHSTIFIAAVAVMAPFIGVPLLIATHWKQTKVVLGAVWGWIKDAAQNTFGAVVGFAGQLADKVSGAVKGGLNLVVGFVNDIIDVLDKIPFVEIGHVAKVGGSTGVKFGPHSKTAGKHAGGEAHAQRGGIMVPGQGTGDKVPALLEPGEVVWNRKAVAVMGGAQRANEINRRIPRFKLGDVVGDVGGAIGGAAKDVAGLPGKALDLAGGGAQFFINQLPHPNLPSWLGNLGQGLIEGAIAFAKDKVNIFGGSGGDAAVRGAMSTAGFLEIARVARRKTGAGNFSLAGLLSLAQQESGLRVNPPPPHDINWDQGNPSMGLMQITGTNFKAYHQRGTSRSIIDPIANVAASINYQKGRYGRQVTFSPYARGGVVGQPFNPRLMRGARSAAPRRATGGIGAQSIGRIIKVANEVARMHLPYLLGGGHTQPATLPSSGVDCSAAVSYLLQKSGFNKPTAVSGDMASWFGAGPGRDFTIWANPEHVFAQIRDKMWGTNTGDGGPGWHTRSTAGFTARHPDLAAAAVVPGAGARKPLSPKAKRDRAKSKRKALVAKIIGAGPLVGVSPSSQGKIDNLTGQIAQLEEYVGYAEMIGTDATEGVFQGLSESGWLNKELGKLLALRNTLLTLFTVLENTKKRLARDLKNMRAELGRLTAIKPAKRSKGQSSRIENLRREIPLGVAQLNAANAALGGDSQDSEGILGQLAGVQGSGVTLPGAGILKTPLAHLDLGQVGGQILLVQNSLRDLAANATGTADNTLQVELLRQLLKEANLRTAVSEAQIKTLRETPLPPYAGSFAVGGVVPGPPGAPRTVIAHGGETINPIAGAAPSVIQVVVEDGAVDHRRIRVIANEETKVEMRRQARGGNRPLAGRAGGLT